MIWFHVADSWMQHVIIGLDNTQVFADLDLAAASATDFAREDDNDDDEDDDGSDDDEESDFEDDFNNVVKKIILKLLSLPVQALGRLLINHMPEKKMCRRVCLLLTMRTMRTMKTKIYRAGPTSRP